MKGNVRRTKVRRKSGGRGFRFRDLFVVILCIAGAALSFRLFWNDLYQTLSSRTEEQIGVVVVKNNIVQRRMADRVIWDRLVKESPVYSGDMIRVAEISSASLFFDDKQLELNENTLIRIQRMPGEDGAFRIELSSGEIGLVAGNDSGNITLNILGREVQAGPGVKLNAAASADGMTLQMSEGNVVVNDGGQSRELSAGTLFDIDSAGNARTQPAAIVTRPRSNARFLQTGTEPEKITFSWNRFNLALNETLRLEISGDWDFTQIVQRMENLDSTAEAALGAGYWYWRLCYADSVLGRGQLTVTEAPGPVLLSPSTNQIIRYEDEFPKVDFQWTQSPEADYYIIQVSETPDFNFRNLRINMRTRINSFSEGSLESGIWYWRVLPMFPSVYDGIPVFSSAVSFNVLHISEPEPEPIIEEVEEPEPEPEPVIVHPVLLEAPSQGASIAGLTALRQETVFRWSSEDEVGRSRFVLSRNPNPLQGRPSVEIRNPGQTIRLNRLEEGVWYWTIEAETPDGVSISAEAPRQFRVLAIPLLPAAANRRPAAGYRIGIEELQARRNITFSWSAVSGANAYIVTILQQTSGGRRQIVRTAPQTQTSYTLNNLTLLDRGTFFWQVEAVNRNRSGVIEQRGRAAENIFVIDIPVPGEVQIEEPGILYGN